MNTAAPWSLVGRLVSFKANAFAEIKGCNHKKHAIMIHIHVLHQNQRNIGNVGISML